MASEVEQPCRTKPLAYRIWLKLLDSVPMTQDAQLVAGVRELVRVENNLHMCFRNTVSRVNETRLPFTRLAPPTPPTPAWMWKKMVRQKDTLPCREVTKKSEVGKVGGARTGSGIGARESTAENRGQRSSQWALPSDGERPIHSENHGRLTLNLKVVPGTIP